MHPFHIVPLAHAFLLLSVPAQGARLDLIRRPSSNTPSVSSHIRRTDNSASLRDKRDISYFTNITIGGVQVEVIMDSGSSDLWVLPPVQSGEPTGKTTALDYAQGHVEGPIELAQLEFAGYTIPKQAFMQADATKTHDLPDGLTGILGLGPDFGSQNLITVAGVTNGKLGTSNVANTVLGNILKDDPETPPLLTFSLARDFGPNSSPDQDTLTIGEVLPGLEAINSEPKLTLFRDVVASPTLAFFGHWTTLLDASGVKVNGKPVTLPPSLVQDNPTKERLVAMFDSGFSFPQVPKAVTDALYESIPGAVFDNSQNLWSVPCDVEINMSWTFGGKDIPVHPLDIVARVSTISGVSPKKGTPDACVGLWQPAASNIQQTIGPDLILGMPFLRNTYILINMGGAVGVNNPQFDSTQQGFIQLLSTTDTSKTHDEFKATRASTKNNANGVIRPVKSILAINTFMLAYLTCA